MKILSVKGVRRTGNNFLISTLDHNLNVKVNSGGGSHKLIKEPNPEHTVHFITIIKNPYSWFLSITNWAKRSWGSGWSKASWKHDWNKFEKLCIGFNTFYRVNLEFFNTYSTPSFIVRYEDFLRDPNPILDNICSVCNIEFKTDKLYIPNKVPQSSSFSTTRRKFYLDGDGTFGLNEEIIKKINMCVDWELMLHYGYKEIR